MPTVSEATQADLSAYVPSASLPYNNGASPISGDMQPGRSSVMRCPMPPIWSASPDALRQFYLKGTTPQIRFMTPAPPVLTTTPVTQSVSSAIVINGGGGGGGTTSGTISAQQTSITTPALGPGTSFSGVLNTSKSFQLLQASVGSPCRVRLYGTQLAQSQDLGRGLDQPPAAGSVQNIIADIALDTVPYQWTFQGRVGANGDLPQNSAVYVTVTNIDSTSDIVTLTLSYVPLENSL